ncbi:MAG TPA: nuclear transport factor 2 family protein [Flavobacteriales bacterium]|nr:nuclear transport factor 2 family protein [Flavobacteriales bacterium]
MNTPPRLFVVLLLTFLAFGARAQERPADERAVLAVIDRFFACLATRDSAGMAAILEPDGSFGAVLLNAEARAPRMHTHASYLANLKKGTDAWLERYWDARVQLDEGVAVVTCPYDFHVNAVFSHCGLDIFTLLHHADGWKIAGAVFSMKKDGCELSPLGPVKP